MLEELKEKTEHENSKLQELGKQCALLAQERDQVQETLECVQAEKKKLEVNLQESINKVLCLWLKYNNYKCWRTDRLFLETVSEKFLMGIIYPNWKILVSFNFCLGELYFRIHTSSFKNLIWGFFIKKEISTWYFSGCFFFWMLVYLAIELTLKVTNSLEIFILLLDKEYLHNSKGDSLVQCWAAVLIQIQ